MVAGSALVDRALASAVRLRYTTSTLMRLMALPVFAWLFFPRSTVWRAPRARGNFSIRTALALPPTRDTLVGLVTRDTAGRSWRARIAVPHPRRRHVVVLPYFMLAGLETVFVPARWAERPGEARFTCSRR